MSGKGYPQTQSRLGGGTATVVSFTKQWSGRLGSLAVIGLPDPSLAQPPRPHTAPVIPAHHTRPTAVVRAPG